MDTEKRADTEQAAEYRQLAAALVDISEHVRRDSHAVTGFEPLPNGMLDILRTIENHPGITVAQLAARLDRQLSNVSAQLKDLVARGLVTRHRDPSDKRFVELHATAEAHRIKDLFEASWAQALAETADRLLPTERGQLRSMLPLLERLASAADYR